MGPAAFPAVEKFMQGMTDGLLKSFEGLIPIVII